VPFFVVFVVVIVVIGREVGVALMVSAAVKLPWTFAFGRHRRRE
jgi:hypothetical protein